MVMVVIMAVSVLMFVIMIVAVRLVCSMLTVRVAVGHNCALRRLGC
jgi:hypothetical protein